ncbi:M3 family oligoendopeptidase [Helcococcus kunzii]|uniref:M3 family oligoendopeptidase n=1 Tax=Helcococcus kunzii TaxID=40091 RepID=UPI0021A4BB92|nr:M3 family oligoendopeptidase [Helcococcus kunzii]MCT1795831.1 M3 family oligoendopeptidase [Helcococcus kunzii]MCT1989830.1 M3 family oligoendopeptidase [Helcococcus kunzii]
MKFRELEYTRPDFDSLLNELNEKLDLIENAKTSDEYLKLLHEVDTMTEDFSEAANIAYIRNTIDTRDEFYEKEVEVFDEIFPKFSQFSNKLQNIRLKSPFRKDFEEKYGKNITKTDELQKDIFNPSIMEDRIKESKLANEYQKLMGTAEIEFDGKKLNLSQLTPYKQSKDRAVRKAAAKASSAWFNERKDQFDRIYDELVKVRHQIAKKLGFDSYLDVAYRSFGRTDWGREDAKNYRDQIVKYIVPLANKLYEEQKERIGVEDFLYYDIPLKFLSGNPTPKGTEEELVDYAKKMYKELSPETEEFFNAMIEHEMMHLTSQDGKAPGGYMTQLDKTKLPFIFANFNGTAHDVDVLTHEAGHAFQGYLTRDVYPSDVRGACMEIMETHSMSMEYFTHTWMEGFFKEDTEKYYYNHVVYSLEFLPYGASIDEYQEWVYDNPEATPEERNNKFREIEKKYSPHIDYADDEYMDSGRRWQAQMHVYSSPFYYLDYTIAQMNAFQFFVLDMENHEDAWNKYLELCKLGGKLGTKEIISKVGLKNPFEKETFKYVVPRLEEYLESLDHDKIK